MKITVVGAGNVGATVADDDVFVVPKRGLLNTPDHASQYAATVVGRGDDRNGWFIRIGGHDQSQMRVRCQRMWG